MSECTSIEGCGDFFLTTGDNDGFWGMIVVCGRCGNALHWEEARGRLNEHAALKRENKRLLDGIRNARHCLTHGRNTTPTEGEEFDIGTTYTKLSMMLGEPWSTLLTAEEEE